MTYNTKQAIAKSVLETLEGRQYMSAATIGLANGVLSLQADPNTASTLKVVLSADKSSVTATAGDQTQTFKFSQLKSLVLTGSTGDDYIYVDAGLNLPAQIKANGGNDTIWGGSGLDNVDGGDGNVQIHAHGVITTGSGNDSVWGSNQGDTITVGSGTDLVVCGNGSNVVYGGSGHDTLIGGAGNDQIIAGSGTTVIYGGMGDDTLVGGTGHDTIYGGGGDNSIAVNSNATVLHAQSTDVAVAGPLLQHKSSPAKKPVSSPSPAPTPAPAPPTAGGLKPVITQLETTVIAGEGVNVNALTSTIPSGTILTTTYKWNFGDPSSKHNVLPGWNAGHVYDTAGNYTITLTMTDSAGHVATTTSKVTVTADTRPVIYVDTNGSDSNTGASPTQAVQTAGQAFALAGSNTKIEFKRGETFDVNYWLMINGHDEYVGAYGTGANPVLNFTGTDPNYMVTIFVASTATNTTIQDITFDSPNGITSGAAPELGIVAIWAGGTNLVVSNNTFLNVDDAVNATLAPTGVIVQDNSAPSLTALRGYFCWVDGNNWTIVGNDVANTTRQHCIRSNDTNTSDVLIYDNNLSKVLRTDDPGEIMKTTINFRGGNHIFVAQNVLNYGELGFGPDVSMAADASAQWIVAEDNYLHDAVLGLKGSTDHVMINNNYLDATNEAQIQIIPQDTAFPTRTMTDITISDNTGVNTGTYGGFLQLANAANPGTITLTRNVYMATNEVWGQNLDAPVALEGAADLSGFAAINGNIWPSANPGGTGIVNYVANFATGNSLTPQQWGAQSEVQNDQFANVNMPSGTYQMTLNGKTAGAGGYTLGLAA